ncbi:MAG: cupin domain-containing protein [Bacteroidia bacterium]
MVMSVDDWIQHLDLLPHPEGGYYQEVYRAAETIPAHVLPPRYGGDRPFATGIYFLLTGDTFSAFHRIDSDETWHYYTGTAPLHIYAILPDGRLHTWLLGIRPDRGESPQVVVPQGCWFAAQVAAPAGYVLAGCTVAPGFDFAGFELAQRDALIAAYPQHRAQITALTRV